MEVLNLFSVILDLLAWTALIRLLYCPGLKFKVLELYYSDCRN